MAACQSETNPLDEPLPDQSPGNAEASATPSADNILRAATAVPTFVIPEGWESFQVGLVVGAVPPKTEVFVVTPEEFGQMLSQAATVTPALKNLDVSGAKDISGKTLVVRPYSSENIMVQVCMSDGPRLKVDDLVGEYEKQGYSFELEDRPTSYKGIDSRVMRVSAFPGVSTWQAFIYEDRCNSLVSYTTHGDSREFMDQFLGALSIK